MSTVPHDDLFRRLPLPLAQLYRRAHNAKTPLERHLAAYYLWECGLKLLGAAAVVEYAELGEPHPELAGALANLARPAVGHWWEFARRLVPVLADRGVAGYPGVKDLLLGRTRDDCPGAAGLDAALLDVLDGKPGGRATVRFTELFDRLVRYRNHLIGHGAAGQHRDEFNRRMADALLVGLGDLFGRLDVLAGRRLIHVESVRPVRGVWLVQRYELAGEVPRRLEAAEVPRESEVFVPDEGHVYLWNPADPPGRGLRSLQPLVLFEPEAGEALFLNARRGRARVEYLCYTSGRVSDRDDLGPERRALLTRALGLPVSPADEQNWASRSHAEEPPAEEPVPARRLLGEFELLSELGRGGMGVVYRAWQPSLRRQVALKKLLPTADLSRAEDRFRREIRALGRVEHPHLVKVYTSGADGEHWYYAMELIEGAPLSAVCETLAARSPAAAVDLPTWNASVSTACEKARREEKPLSGSPPLPAREPAAECSHEPAKGGRAYLRQVVELMMGVAEAAHALHEAGVVHRDIKPGNVLVSPDGTRAVLMDLGLAQVADEVDGKLTRTRQFVGTLRYASPEQVLAVGGVDRRADVYGLGATLWEVVSLRPLFGATDQTPTPQLMLDIQQREPDRLRGCNPTVGRDLEAVVHKCLEKRPEKRYASARALADELRRVLAGEPVEARPVSSLDRGLKWVRRNPGVAGAVAAVALALVAGSAVSIAFGLEAKREARRANDEADRANGEAARAEKEADAARQERSDAINARNDLIIATALLDQKNDSLNLALAKALLAPIRADRDAPLTPYEVDAFWGLADQRGTPVSFLFLELATATPHSCEQLQARAEVAFHSAIGLDVAFRDRVERLLLARLQTVGLPREQRLSLALACLDADCSSPELARQAATLVAEGVVNPSATATQLKLAKSLRRGEARLGPQELDAICAPAVAALTDTLAKTSIEDERRGLGVVCDEAVHLLEPRHAADLLAAAIEKSVDPDGLRILVGLIDGVAARMKPELAMPTCNRAAAALAGVYGKTADELERGKLAEALGKLAARMDPGRTAELLVKMLRESPRDLATNVLAKSLGAVAARMAPAEAAAALADAIEYDTDPDHQRRWAERLAAVAARMAPGKADAALTRAAGTLCGAIKLNPPADATRDLARGLAAVASAMNRARAEAVCTPVATELADKVVSRARAVPNHRSNLAAALMAVAARMDPAKADALVARTADRLLDDIRSLRDDADVVIWNDTGRALAAVATRLKPEKAADICASAADRLIERMATVPDRFEWGPIEYTLAALAMRMEPGKAGPLLVQIMPRTYSSESADKLLDAMGQVIARLETEQAATLLADTLESFPRSLAQGNPAPAVYLVNGLADQLLTVVKVMPRAKAEIYLSRAAAAVVPLLAKPHDRYGLRPLSSTLVRLVTPLDPNQAQAHCARAAIGVTEALEGKLDEGEPRLLDEPLATLTSHIERRQATDLRTRAAVALVQHYKRAENPRFGNQLAWALATVAEGMDSNQADAVCAEVAALLIDAIGKTTEANKLTYLADSVAALVPRMKPDHAGTLLADAVERTTNGEVLAKLAGAATGVVARMEPAKADALCTKLAAKLMTAIADPNDQAPVADLARTLVAVARRMEPEKAARLLLDALVTTADIGAVDQITKGLAVAAAGAEMPTPERQFQTGLLGAAGIGNPHGLWPHLPILRLHVPPQPKLLPPQVLVELLKHPMCGGEARRAVLDALELTYRRKFADQWDFVRFVKDDKLELDLTLPPKRPAR